MIIDIAMQFIIKIMIGRLSIFTKKSVYKKSDQPIGPKTSETEKALSPNPRKF